MMLLPRVAVMSAAMYTLMAVAACSVEHELDQLTETQTKLRAKTAIPSSTLFGVELRRPTGLPMCDAIPAEEHTCTDGEMIRLQESEVPAILDRDYLLVTWDAEHRVQSILATTKHASAAQTLDTLIRKFGKPDRREPNTVPGYDRWQWTYQDAEVVYLDNGQDVTVVLETAEQARLDEVRISREIEEETRQASLQRTL